MTNLREALIDLEALASNVRTLVSMDPYFAADLAGDAYGHGAVRVAATVVEAGVRRIRVRDGREREALLPLGIDAQIAPADRLGSRDAGALYGLGPLARRLVLRPVMRVSALVISTKAIAAGEPVSYGYTWRAPVDGNLAIVPLGYADGVTRSAGNRGAVWVAGAARPIVGRVAMDVMVLDTGTDRVEVGAEAVLFGDRRAGAATADTWSRVLGIPALQATSGVGARVQRRWR